MLRFFLICNNIFLIFYQIFFTWGIGIYVWNYNIKGVAMTSLDLDGCVYKKQIKMRNKQLFTTSCICYILLYLSSILYFFIFSALFFFFFFYFKILAKISCTIKMMKGTHLMSPCKTINLFQDVLTKLSQKKVSYG